MKKNNTCRVPGEKETLDCYYFDFFLNLEIKPQFPHGTKLYIKTEMKTDLLCL